MSPEHIILQTIACYGRVNIGNFEDNLHRRLSMLVVDGKIEMSGAGDTVWVTLTNKGRDSLHRLNSALPGARFACVTDTKYVD